MGYCQNIDVIICKVLNSSGKSRNSPLVAALIDLLDTNVNIICMPLSFAGFENGYVVNIIHKLLEEILLNTAQRSYIKNYSSLLTTIL